ncbi:MAG TPA: hypothetical protein VI457_08970, partial [Methylococcaceae bacterium]|nr:hypothetical protein [Methylococcaceae bacterium]
TGGLCLENGVFLRITAQLDPEWRKNRFPTVSALPQNAERLFVQRFLKKVARQAFFQVRT